MDETIIQQTLGGYQLRRVISKSPTTTVYEGLDPKLGRRAAIKVVQYAGLPDAMRAELLARFRQEAQLTARLDHPGLLNVFGYDETPSLAFLAMEYVDGPTMKAALEGDAHLPIARVVAILTDALRTLEHCHRNGVVHRDIKPSNLLLPGTGGVKIADLGIARPEDSQMRTQVGTWIGTPPYMSPEQFNARAPVDARTDIWSCGVVLYEALTGQRPFSGDENNIAFAVTVKNPPAPSAIVPGIAPALDAVVARAMAKDPNERYATAADFSAALQAAMPTASASAPSVAVDRTRPPARRWVMAILFALLALIATAAGGLWWQHQELMKVDAQRRLAEQAHQDARAAMERSQQIATEEAKRARDAIAAEQRRREQQAADDARRAREAAEAEQRRREQAAAEERRKQIAAEEAQRIRDAAAAEQRKREQQAADDARRAREAAEAEQRRREQAAAEERRKQIAADEAKRTRESTQTDQHPRTQPTTGERRPQVATALAQAREADSTGKFSDAAQFYKTAADQGNGAAQHRLAQLYESGLGVEKSYSEAARLYRLAANQGIADALYSLGASYELGRGVAKSQADAVPLYQQAARQGHGTAQYALRRLGMGW